MPIEAPKLDDRDFEMLFEQAKARIPRYLPEWTNHNESDPGIAILQLHAWLSEVILFRLNQLPEANHIHFLRLLGVEQRPARPASANLTFVLDADAVNGPDTFIEMGTRVGVDAPDLDTPVVFETDRELRAITASLVYLLTSSPDKIEDVTQDNNVDVRPIYPFGQNAAAQHYLILGFESPFPFSSGEIGLHFELYDPSNVILAEVEETVCGLIYDDGLADALVWQWWDGIDWEALDVTEDQTKGLTQSGQVYFRIPGQIPAVALSQALDVPAPILPQLQEVDGLDTSLITALASSNIVTVAQLANTSHANLMTAFSWDPTSVELQEDAQAILNSAQELNEAVPLIYWLRVGLRPGATYPPNKIPRVDRVLTNTVSATAAQSVFDEVVGGSDGSPNQTFNLRHRPVLAAPELVLEIDEGDGFEPWEQVPDFYESGPQHTHYRFIAGTGELIFGDGIRGRIPVAGQFNIVARHYRYGGGRITNVAAQTIVDLQTSLRNVEEVTNIRAAIGGMDAEDIEMTKLRAAREMKHQDRAITLMDFQEHALATPNVPIARSHAYVEKSQDSGGDTIRVVIIPDSAEPYPKPSAAMRAIVCAYLDQRRLITTQIEVVDPTYVYVIANTHVQISTDASLREVNNDVAALLQSFLHPLQGGRNRQGWAFGSDIYYSEVLGEIMKIEGVVRVANLEFVKLLARKDEVSHELAVQAEVQAFGASYADSRQIDITVVDETGENSPTTESYWAVVYECSDVPVQEGALVALLFPHSTITVDYAR